MATTYSVQKTKWSQNSPKDFIKPNEIHGRVRIAYALYEASAVAVGTIEMFNLPNGARILSGPITVVIAGAAATGTIELTMLYVVD